MKLYCNSLSTLQKSSSMSQEVLNKGEQQQQKKDAIIIHLSTQLRKQH